jgi:hypothetical protein
MDLITVDQVTERLDRLLMNSGLVTAA